jgi:hypothetical protein
MGAFMITREEGIWIYPMLFLLLSCCLFFVWRGKMDDKLFRSFLVLLPMFLWCLPIFGVSYLNYSHYGYWGTTELLDPDFNRALNTLGRIKVNTSYPHVQVTQEALRKAYKVSPLLSGLKKAIGEITPAYLHNSNLGLREYPDWYLLEYSDKGAEVGRGHFLWLMRDAVYSSGYYAAGKYSHEFYRQLADQLESACNSGELDCVSKRTLPINRRYIPIVLRMFQEGFVHLLHLDGVAIISADLKSWRPQDDVPTEYYEQLIYDPIAWREFDDEKIVENSINGEADLRLKTIHIKVEIMKEILKVSRGFTLPAFAASFIAWMVFMILFVSKKRREAQAPFLVISIFLIGLIFSRLTTLVLAVGGASTRYGVTIHLFIYLLIFLLLYWCVDYLSIPLSGRDGSEKPILEDTSAKVYPS